MTRQDSKSDFRSSIDVTKEFPTAAGVHQRSLPSPLLYIAAMDAVIYDIQKAPPWNLLFLAVEDHVQKWTIQLQRFSLKPETKKTAHMGSAPKQTVRRTLMNYHGNWRISDN